MGGSSLSLKITVNESSISSDSGLPPSLSPKASFLTANLKPQDFPASPPHAQLHRATGKHVWWPETPQVTPQYYRKLPGVRASGAT